MFRNRELRSVLDWNVGVRASYRRSGMIWLQISQLRPRQHLFPKSAFLGVDVNQCPFRFLHDPLKLI
jgi:hypothetical protein